MNKAKIHTVERRNLDLFDTPVSNKIHQKNCRKHIQNPLKFKKTH
jgi:hypothetical protein